MQRCALVAKQESRTHMVEERELYMEGRDTLVEMRKTDEYDMEEFGTLLVDSIDKPIAILGDRWWP